MWSSALSSWGLTFLICKMGMKFAFQGNQRPVPCCQASISSPSWQENSKFPLANHSSPVGFPGGTSGQELTCQCRRHKRQGFHLWVRKIPWRRARQPSAVFLPGESHGQRSLAGYSPWGCRVGQDWSNLTHMHVCIHYSLSSGLRLTQCLALRWPEWSNLVNISLAPWS